MLHEQPLHEWRRGIEQRKEKLLFLAEVTDAVGPEELDERGRRGPRSSPEPDAARLNRRACTNAW